MLPELPIFRVVAGQRYPISPDFCSSLNVEQVIALVARDIMDELAFIHPSLHLSPISPPPRALQFPISTPHTFVLSTYSLLIRNAHDVGGPRGTPLTPTPDTVIQEASSSYRVDVPPPPSLSIYLEQFQELCLPQLRNRWPGSADTSNEDAFQVSVLYPIFSPKLVGHWRLKTY